MNNKLIGILLIVAMIMASCAEHEPEKVKMPPTLATQYDAFKKDTSSTHKAERIYWFMTDVADTSTSDRDDIALWYEDLANTLKIQEHWALSENAIIEALRYNPSSKEAPEHLIELAQQLHVKQDRLPVSKAAYQAIVEYYPESDEVKEAKENIAADQPSLDQQVQDLEKKLMKQSKDSVSINLKAAEDYITAVQLLAAIDPNHEEVPVLLNRAARMANGLGNNRQAVHLYNWVIYTYEDSESAKKALFYKGFTLDEELKNFAAAEQAYETFLNKYPNDPLASDVKMLKGQLGKSDEEILEELKRKNANQ